MATAVLEKFLGQLTGLTLAINPNGVQLVGGVASSNTIVKNITICNTGTTDATFSIHFFNDGSSATSANALFFDYDIRAKSTTQIDTYIILESTLAEVMVRTDFPSLVFTSFGVTVTR